MTILAHAAMGAGLMAVFTRVFQHVMLKSCRVNGLWWTLVVFGALSGAGPDLITWVAFALGFTPEWGLYAWTHDAPNFLWTLPPYLLHVAMDRLIHDNVGVNWWPAYWWTEWLTWTVATGLITWGAACPKKHTS